MLPEIAARGFAWNKNTGVCGAFAPRRRATRRQRRNEEALVRRGAVDTAYWSNGRPMVSGMNDKTLKLWDPATGKL